MTQIPSANEDSKSTTESKLKDSLSKSSNSTLESKLDKSDPLRYRQAVNVITTPLSFWTATLVASAGGLLIWSILGRIPITTTSSGVITNPFMVVSVSQAGNPGGVYSSINYKPGDYVKKGDILATVSYLSNTDSIQQAQQKLEIAKQQFDQQYNTPQFKLLLTQQSNAVQSALNYLNSAKSIAQTGVISSSTVNSAAQSYQQAVQNQLTTTSEVVSAQANLNTLKGAYQSSLVQAKQSSQIISEYSGQVTAVFASVGQQNTPNSALMQINKGTNSMNRGSSAPLSLVAYFSPSSAAKLKKGQEVRILPSNVTPNTIGNLLGTVDSVSTYPLTTQEASSIIGSDSLATELLSNGNSTQVIIKLEASQTSPSGYVWINGSGPSVTMKSQYPKVGILAAASVITDYVPPITIGIPALKRFFGIES